MRKEKLLRAENRMMLKIAGRPIRWGLSAFADILLRVAISYGITPPALLGWHCC